MVVAFAGSRLRSRRPLRGHGALCPRSTRSMVYRANSRAPEPSFSAALEERRQSLAEDLLACGVGVEPSRVTSDERGPWGGPARTSPVATRSAANCAMRSGPPSPTISQTCPSVYDGWGDTYTGRSGAEALISSTPSSPGRGRPGHRRKGAELPPDGGGVGLREAGRGRSPRDGCRPRCQRPNVLPSLRRTGQNGARTGYPQRRIAVDGVLGHRAAHVSDRALYVGGFADRRGGHRAACSGGSRLRGDCGPLRPGRQGRRGPAGPSDGVLGTTGRLGGVDGLSVACDQRQDEPDEQDDAKPP